MNITRTRVDLGEERRILTHMIVSSEYLSQLRGIGEARLFESGFARTIAGWVWEFYEIAKEAPGRAIEDIWRRKAPEIRDEAQTTLISEYLTSLSREWEQASPNNVTYSTGQALAWFKLRSLAQLRERLDAALAGGDHGTAERLIGEYRRIERPGGSRVDMLSPDHIGRILGAFTSVEDPLLRLPGALGDVIGPIIRGDFIGVVAPPKRGKSWFADFIAQHGVVAGCRTLVLNLEMTEEQMIRRRWQGMLGVTQDKPAKVQMPRFISMTETSWHIDQTEENVEGMDGVTAEDIATAQTNFRRTFRSGVAHLECMSGAKLSPAKLRSYLQNADTYDGIQYDLVVLDAPYLMQDDGANRELRHRLDAINRDLRAIAQEFSIAMVVTHQGDATTIDGKKDVKAGSTSESKVGILSHYTKMIALNQREREKRMGLWRVACDITRDGEGTAGQAVVLNCLKIGRPYLDSRMLHQTDLDQLMQMDESVQ